MRRFFIVISFVFIFLGFYGIYQAEAASYERLFYYREGPQARKSFFSHPSSIDIFAPQTYKVDENGFLAGSVEPDLLIFAKKNKIKVMPLAINRRNMVAMV